MAASASANHDIDGTKNSLQKEKAKARWSILRNALLQKAQSSQEHSIHQFAGYQLIKPLPPHEMNVGRLGPLLKKVEWSNNYSLEENLQRLEVSILTLGCCFPKGCCIEISNCTKEDRSWIETIKHICQPSVNLLLVKDDKSRDSITLLVQEGSSTKYKACQYVLDDVCSLWTREPRETRLSLQDLVSHRTTGVDNTGNICVWDSERTLACLLYNRLSDFPKLSSSRNILELGTGMAGLAGIALGLRLVQEKNDKTRKINVCLTDGHVDGVKNNIVNQHLTRLYSSARDHPYHSLDVSAQVLLWTTDVQSALEGNQDVALVSDCTHFQNFHAALAITMLRSLRLGGQAVFCQPRRGNSLENFCNLLEAGNDGLTLVDWWTHSALEEQHYQAMEEYPGVYDENLHRPKILLITKLRELTKRDCQTFIGHQQDRELSDK